MGTPKPARQQQDSIFRLDSGNGGAMSGISEMEKNEEIAGKFTQALAKALQKTIGSKERVFFPDQQLAPTLPRTKSSSSQQSPPSPHTLLHDTRKIHIDEDNTPYTDFMSIDGHFMTQQQQKIRQETSKLVPQTIAIERERVPQNVPAKPKKENNLKNDIPPAERHHQQQ